MHIEIRTVKGGKKYYLAHSYRVNGTPRKIRVYLGLNLKKEQLDDKRKVGEERIKARVLSLKATRDPYKTVLTGKELKELKSMEPGGAIRLMHLSEEDWLKFTELFTYNTNAIEGSSVGKGEVKEILERDKWPDKPKEEISETFGVAEAVKYIRTTKEHISLNLIKELHRIIFKNSKPFAGSTRKRGEEVAVFDAYGNIVHRGAPSASVLLLLKELVRWYAHNKKRYPPLVLAAVVHNRFESIHPFVDGNGRVGRLLLINILLKHDLPPVNIELSNRGEYYVALQSYENEGNIRPMIELLLKEYKKTKNLLKG